MVTVWMHTFPHNDRVGVHESNHFSILGGPDWMSVDCGGSLITKYHVISAAHCIAQADSKLWVEELE